MKNRYTISKILIFILILTNVVTFYNLYTLKVESVYPSYPREDLAGNLNTRIECTAEPGIMVEIPAGIDQKLNGYFKKLNYIPSPNVFNGPVIFRITFGYTNSDPVTMLIGEKSIHINKTNYIPNVENADEYHKSVVEMVELWYRENIQYKFKRCHASCELNGDGCLYGKDK